MKEPHRWYWHPHMGWLDLFIGIVLYFVLPLTRVLKKDRALQATQQLRNTVISTGLSGTKKALKHWGTYLGCDILQCNRDIPRRSVLREWGLLDTTKDPSDPSDSPISLRIHFPASILKGIDYDSNSRDKNPLGCPVVSVDISELNVPMMLCIHGGGFHTGDSMEPSLIELMTAVAKFTHQPFMCAFFTYRQIPEHCFPAAIEDVLTVTTDLLERFSHVHIVGVSAGANLATVATMELHRRHPGRIRSATLLCPMLNPAANSMSYYMNRNVWFVPPEWLRWCWRTYLGLSSPQSCLIDHDSNVPLWEESIWRKHVLARFIDPTIDLPDQLDDTTPQFIVTTNQADPLCDEGDALVDKMRARGAHVQHFRHAGSHWLGTAMDLTELVREMARVLFPLRV